MAREFIPFEDTTESIAEIFELVRNEAVVKVNYNDPQNPILEVLGTGIELFVGDIIYRDEDGRLKMICGD